MHALRIPSTALSQSQAMQLAVEKAVSRLPEVAFVFSKTGTAEMASDPMPPNASDTFIILKPRDQWPDPSLTKEGLIERDRKAAVDRLPGNVYEFTQPIQMRFNELLAGVRGDIAVKVFGDEFEPMLKAANQIAAALRAVRGATDVKVEQAGGLPVLEIKVDKVGDCAARPQRIGGAGGDRGGGRRPGGRRGVRGRPQLRHRRAAAGKRALRSRGARQPAGGASAGDAEFAGAEPPLNRVARFSFSEGPNQISRENGKRRIVVTANVRGRDLGSVVEEAQMRVKQVVAAARLLDDLGRTVREPCGRPAKTRVVVPACFAMIFLLLLAAMGSARDALLVFSAVPLALTGGVFALWLRGMPFSISAAVGFIALSGIAVLNGLVMLSYRPAAARERRAARAAIERAR